MNVAAKFELVKGANLDFPRYHAAGPSAAISTPRAMRSPPASAPT